MKERGRGMGNHLGISIVGKKEYKVIYIEKTAEQTEKILNKYSKEGWQVICPYAHNNEYIILQREVKDEDKKKRM